MKKSIKGENLAPAIGPYSAGISFDQMVFTSGQIAMDPESGGLITDQGIAAETHQVMKNLQAVLKAADAAFSDVVKCSIFLSDMAHFPVVNEVYASYLSEPFPARETVAVRTLPKNVNVEISCIAIRPEKRFTH